MEKYSKAEYQKQSRLTISISQSSIIAAIANAAVFGLLFIFYIYYLVDYSFLNIRLIATGFVAVVCILATMITNGFGSLSKTIWFPFLMVICWLLGMLFYSGHYSNITNIYCSVSYFFIAVWFMSYENHKSVFFELLFYLVFVTILYKVYVQHVSLLRIIQDGSSYNFISVIGLFYYMISNFTRVVEKKPISLIQTICMVILAVTGYGRGGIVVGFVLLALVLFNRYAETKSKSFKLFITLAAIVVIAIISVSIESVFEYVFSSTNILGKFTAKGTFNGDRAIIWGSYILDTVKSPIKSLFGGNAYITRYDGNLHNSFLQMHAQYGLIFLAVNVYLLIKIVLKSYKANNKEITILILVFAIRCITDRLMYHGFSEVVYYMFISYYLLNRGLADQSRTGSFSISMVNGYELQRK